MVYLTFSSSLHEDAIVREILIIMSPSSSLLKSYPTLDEEKLLWSQGIRPLAGVDEVGRGPLAGAVVAAAVILPEQMDDLLQASLAQLNDSKKISPSLRQKLYTFLTEHAEVIYALGEASVLEIDELNILEASALAMRRAVVALKKKPAYVLVDGLPVKNFPFPQHALIGGDGCSLSIAAASVIAKVTRDRMMEELDLLFPHYGFARHRGYGTREHLENLRRYGPCQYHRRSFKPVAQASL